VSQILVENANWRLSGELTFATVGALLTEFTQKLSSFSKERQKGNQIEVQVFSAKKLEPRSPPKVLDLSDITRTDSAGLALLIELRRQNASMTFCNIPAQMHKLATLSGVQEMIN